MRAWAFLAGLAVVGGASAQVTSLVTIPIADTKGVFEAELGHYVSGTERSIDPRYYHYTYLVVGIHDRVEAAFATDYLGWNVWGFKVKAIDDRNGNYAVSAGFQDIRGNESTPFVVGRYNFGDVRLHGGWIRDDRHRLVCGVDFPLSRDFSMGIDHTSSDGGSTWAGLFYMVPFCEGLCLSANIGVPNNHDDGLQHSFGIIYGFRF